MTEFEACSVTHPKIRWDSDYNNILDHALEKGVSYIIRKNGSTYEAINGSTGKISYGGADDAGSVDGSNIHDVIQHGIIDNTTAFASILYGAGVFDFDDVLTVTDKTISMRGQGFGAYPYDTEGTVLKKSCNGDLLTISSAANRPFWLKDMAIVSDKASYTGSGIVVNDTNVTDYIISDIRLRNFKGNCIDIEASGHHALINIGASYTDGYAIIEKGSDWQWYNVEADWGYSPNGGAYIGTSGEIIGCHFEGFYGLYIDGAIVRVIGSKVFGCEEDGIYVNGGQAQIMGCNISNCNTTSTADGAGIRLVASNDCYIAGNRIADTASKMVYGIYQSGNAYDNAYIGNSIDGVTSKKIYLTQGLSFRNFVKYNSNYMTENSGQETGTGSQQTIAHGLTATPDRLYLTTISDGANPRRTAVSDATNIYITAENAKLYSWKAEVVQTF
jgi:hypothetical protein